VTVIRRTRGLFYEDFEEGRSFQHHWGRTLTDFDTVWFSTTTMNFNRLYFDAEHARANGHPGLVVNPLLVYNVVLGLSVEDLTEAGGPFLGVDGLRFGTPVYPGDTVTAGSVVVSRRPSASRPGWGIVEFHTTGRNQRGETVVDYHRRNLSRMREVEA
jgi:itaconyl-CoA hydratase